MSPAPHEQPRSPAASSQASGRAWLALGLLSSALFMAVALSHLAWADVRRALAAADLWPWLPLGVASYLAGHGVRGLRCRALVRHEARLPLGVATHVVVVGYAVNNILPARLGEVARAGMLAERAGIPFVQALTVTFIERLLDGLTLLGLLVLATSTLPPLPWVHHTLQFGAVVFGSATLVLAVALLAPGPLLAVTSRVTQPLGAGLHRRATELVHQVTLGVADLRHPRRALFVLGTSSLVWLLEAGLFLAVLPAFGLAPAPATALFVMGITNLGILVPSSPGFVGTFHFFAMKCLLALGAAEAVAFGYAATVHLGFYLPITLWGVLVLAGYGVSLGEAVTRARAAAPLDLTEPPPERTAPEPAPEPARFSVALCEALVPASPDGLDPASRAAAARAAAQHLESSAAALPDRLRFLLGAGLLAFRVLTALRFLRPYVGLPLAARRAWTERFADGPVALGRALFRAPRGLALLAWYDHPAVIADLTGSGAGAPSPDRERAP